MEKKDLRIVFMGTPEFAVETLKALVENEYNVVAVVTQPDKPVGRHQTEVQPSEVKKYALEHQLPVLQPEKMKDPAFVEQLRGYKANLQVVVAFRMLPGLSIVVLPPSTGPSSMVRSEQASPLSSSTRISIPDVSSCRSPSTSPTPPMLNMSTTD